MPKYTTLSAIRSRNGAYYGETRCAVNFVSHWGSGIHNDEHARSLGFEGGLVSGLIHDEQFTPLLLAAFGAEWFERGRYSFYYRRPTTDGQPTTAYLEVPPQSDDVQVRAWLATPDGEVISEGSAGIGSCDAPSALATRLDRFVVDRPLRAIKQLRVGDRFPRQLRRFPLHAHGLRHPTAGSELDQPAGEYQMSRRDNTTEPHPWYFGPSRWGGAIAGSLALNRIARPTTASIDSGTAVRIVGGIDLKIIAGPIFVDHDYLVDSVVTGLGTTPRSDVAWLSSEVRDASTEELVATMTLLMRFLI